MPTLEAYRGHMLFSDRNSRYKVLVDGEVVAKVGPNDHATVTVSPGRHVINAKTFWCKSTDLIVDLDEDEHALLRLDNDDRLFGEVTALINPRAFVRITRES